MDKEQNALTQGTMGQTGATELTGATSSQSPTAAVQSKQPNMQGQQSVKAVIGVFESRDNAEKAVKQLRSQGFGTEEINILSKKSGAEKGGDKTSVEYVDDDITDGAMTGGALGGIGGLMVGVGALAIPGIGPIVAAGPIAAALSGAVAGGVAGGLIDWGIPAEESQHYEQSIAQGGILAIIRTDQSKINNAAQILRQNGARDVKTHDQSGS
jgi:hypothetical protein